MAMILLLISLMISSVFCMAKTQDKDSPCPAGWEWFKDACYFINHRPRLAYEQASKKCHNMRANLTSIHSMEEHNFLAEQIQRYIYYIGLNDIDEEGTFIWSDGTQYDGFTQWRMGQPSEAVHNYQDCVGLEWVEGQWKWNDVRCDVERAFICKHSSKVLPTELAMGRNADARSNTMVTAISIAIPAILLVIIAVFAVLLVMKRRNHQQHIGNSERPHIGSPDIKASQPTQNIAGNAYDDAAAPIPRTGDLNGELYEEVLDRPGPGDIENAYNDIRDEQINPGSRNTHNVIRDNEYAYASIHTDPGNSGRHAHAPPPKDEGNQQEGWIDNDIYAGSDEDTPKRQDHEYVGEEQEGWADNSIYD